MFNQSRILIVDDEQINLELFELMLTRLGFIVEKAENGQDALAKVKEFEPDLIVLDNVMPIMTGWEFTQILKSSEEYTFWSDTPVIMFSAINDAQNKVLGFELGVDDYITKPFNFSEILARIGSVLKNRELLVLQKKMKGSLIRYANETAALFQSIQDVSDTAALGEFQKRISDCLEQYNTLKDEIFRLEQESKKLKSKNVDVDSLAQELRSVYNT
ncbi:MAG: response regulator [Spirochaetaceae bacterium]|jgi:DNA-binding response OmpR family regulator|nr:response regulator [Spirochaetaceae bacterium]